VVDERNEKIGYKIRESEMLKTPFMVIVGDKEEQSGCVSVRRHGQGDLGSQPVEQFLPCCWRTTIMDLRYKTRLKEVTYQQQIPSCNQRRFHTNQS
jgi:histidyl-tRNA synthetase